MESTNEMPEAIPSTKLNVRVGDKYLDKDSRHRGTEQRIGEVIELSHEKAKLRWNKTNKVTWVKIARLQSREYKRVD